MTDSELFTIEQSHDRPRLTAPRPSDLGTVPTADDRSVNHNADGTFARGNQAAVGRSAREAVRRPYREAQKRVSEALASRTEPSVADTLLSDALAIYHSARRELGSASAFVHAPVIAFAAETILAGYYMREAANAGFLTEMGMLLHDRALACEQAAARAMTAALAATKALSGRKRRGNAKIAAIMAAGQVVE